MKEWSGGSLDPTSCSTHNEPNHRDHNYLLGSSGAEFVGSGFEDRPTSLFDLGRALGQAELPYLLGYPGSGPKAEIRRHIVPSPVPDGRVGVEIGTIAGQILREAAIALGTGMANLALLFNPQRIIMGGGLSKAGPLLWEPMLETVRARAMAPCQQDLEIVHAGLGDDSGIFGGLAVATLGRQVSEGPSQEC